MSAPRSLAKILAPAVLTALIGLPGAAPLRAADPFYSGLLREGIHDYDSADYAAAARHLRLACFGMLDEPEPLVDCLARLALSQDKGGDPEGFRETFRRIVEVEERFGSYTRAQLPAALKTTFEQRAAVLVPASTLSAVPAFQALVRKPGPGKPVPGDGKPAAPAQTRAETKSDPKSDPKPAPATSKPAAGTPARPAAATPAPAPAQPAPASAPAPKPLADADKQKMAEARRLLGNEGKISELRQAFEAARQVADAHPDSAEAQHLAAEAAYRISRWSDSASYFKRGGEPGADQPELLFYMAVALYESGDRPNAASVLRRCLPNLQRTSYVDGYARKILGETGAP
ncbi:MAG TPA: hypothetical protein VHU81_06795 [Thermoanaerobaculia bacterium]|jgi:tetratricopeptide (TPR) repeat protein|nr:hypothetical protein [Thermoanaerobaculia bacterium]